MVPEESCWELRAVIIRVSVAELKVHVKPAGLRFVDIAEHFTSDFTMARYCVTGASGLSLGNLNKRPPPTGMEVLN